MAKGKIKVVQSQIADDFDKIHPHLAGFVHALQMIDKESPRGMVLTLSGFLEEALERILTAFLCENADTATLFEGARAPLGSFSAKITTCHALGLITDKERDDLDIIRGIRNDFAHHVSASFDVDSIRDRTRNLGLKDDDALYRNEPRRHFQIVAVLITVGVLRRFNLFKKQRRQPLDPKFETHFEDAREGLPPDAVIISSGGTG
jgi:hypothetical protein